MGSRSTSWLHISFFMASVFKIDLCEQRLVDVRFSNRPFGVKRFQTIRHHSVDVRSRARASLRNRHQGPSNMGFEDEAEQSRGRPCRLISSDKFTRSSDTLIEERRDNIRFLTNLCSSFGPLHFVKTTVRTKGG
jgi:hypothetical protein